MTKFKKSNFDKAVFINRKAIRITVAGWLSEHFGIDKSDVGYNVTHLITGQHVGPCFNRLRDAKQFVSLIERPPANWKFGEFGKAEPDSPTLQNARQIVIECGQEMNETLIDIVAR